MTPQTVLPSPPSDPTADRRATQALAWALAAYFGAHLLSRVLVSDALELDEAEQVLWAQQFAWGYGAQPPLYTWLQAGVFELFGLSVASLALLKNALLMSTYGFSFLAARRLLPAPMAALAAASMLLIPQIGWESQRDLTHSVICTTMAAASLWLVVELLHRRRPWVYVALGVAAGLGTLGKYSYAGFAVVLLAALAWWRPSRAVVLSPWMAVTVALAVAVVAPHGVWLLQHLQEATQGTLQKMDDGAAPTYAAGVASGLRSLVVAVVGFLTPLWLVMAVLHGRRAWQQRARPRAPVCALFGRYLVLLAAMFALMVLGGAATQFKDRWMQPYLFFAPMMFLVWVAPADGAWPRQAALRRVIAAMAVLVLLGLSARVAVNGWRDRPDELNAPAGALAAALRQAGHDGRRVVTDDRVLGGLLRLHLKTPVTVVRRGTAAAAVDEPTLWVTTGRAPDRLLALAGSHVDTQAVDLPYRHARPGAAPIRYWFAMSN